jgi:hypothetical protein
VTTPTADPRMQRLAAALKAHDTQAQRIAAARQLAADYDRMADGSDSIARASANLLGAMSVGMLPELCADLEHARRAEDNAHAHHIAAVREGLRDKQHIERLEDLLRAVLSAEPGDMEALYGEIVHVLRDRTDDDLHQAARTAGLLAGGRECAVTS